MKYVSHNALPKWRSAHTPDTCPVLGCEIDDPCVDHDHVDGGIRGVLSRNGNTLIGKIENHWICFCAEKARKSLPDALRAAADYLEGQPTYLHPKGATDLVKRFQRYGKKTQLALCPKSAQGKNKQERAKIYRKQLTSNKWEPNDS